MKRSINTMLKFLLLSLPVMLLQTIVMAQDSTIQTTQTSKTITETTWYAQPWVWIAGGAVVLLILIGLFRSGRSGSSNTDRVTVTKTVERDVDN